MVATAASKAAYQAEKRSKFKFTKKNANTDYMMDLLKALEVLALSVHDPGELEELSALFNRLSI